ncbi:MAG TPA: hypothetical protein VMW34_03515 [Anaerolineales bacterium]|nr:hypothetical protein [Anaerolineales bacterium]
MGLVVSSLNKISGIWRILIWCDRIRAHHLVILSVVDVAVPDVAVPTVGVKREEGIGCGCIRR